MIHRGRYGATGPVHEAQIGTIHVLTREDLPLLAERRNEPPKTIQQLRDSHHLVARLLAAGVRPDSEVARRSGYSLGRIGMLKLDPTFVELVEHYRKEVSEAFREGVDDYAQLATHNMLTAERMLADKLAKLDEQDESLPVRDLIAISRDAADRFGYGKKSTRDLNVNVDFAQQLEKARARVENARVINAVPVASPPLAPPAQQALPLRRKLSQ